MPTIATSASTIGILEMLSVHLGDLLGHVGADDQQHHREEEEELQVEEQAEDDRRRAPRAGGCG